MTSNVIKNSDARNNIVNIFFHCILIGVPRNTWIAPTKLMNTLWEVDMKKLLEKIGKFMEWPDWKMVKGKSHHIFPFAYGGVHKELNHGRLVAQAAIGQAMGFSGHWSILCHKPN
jgi:hypothetical protein